MAAVLLRKPEVRQRFGNAGASTIYDWVSRGLLVHPVRIGPRASAWPESEVEAIVMARIAGKTEDAIRELVAQLESVRRKVA